MTQEYGVLPVDVSNYWGYLTSRIGAPQQKYGDTGVASEAKTPKRIRSMRMRVDRGGTACIIVIQVLIKLIPNNEYKRI